MSNVVGPGMGHLYLGRARRFFIPLVGLILITVVIGRLGFLSSLPGFGLLALWIIGLPLFGIVDGIVLGARSARTAPKWYMRWYVLAAWFVAIQTSAFYFDPVRAWLGYGVYRVPGAYMRPALTPGDIILADSRVSPTTEFAPNTLVVFRHPDSGVLYVLRIKDQADPDKYSLSTGLPFAATVDVPRESIVARVTALIWSPERNEFARALK